MKIEFIIKDGTKPYGCEMLIEKDMLKGLKRPDGLIERWIENLVKKNTLQTMKDYHQIISDNHELKLENETLKYELYELKY